MRNPNRLVACIVAVFLCLGVVWWVYQDSPERVREDVSKHRTAQQAPHNEASQASAPATPVPLTSTVRQATEPNAADQRPSGPVGAIGAFHKWAASFQDADEQTRHSMIKEGGELVKARRLEMEQIYERNPREFLANVLPYGLRKDLPEGIAKELEVAVNGIAKNKTTFAAHGESGRLSFVRRMEVDGVDYRGAFAGVPNGLCRGVSFPVNGAALGRSLALSSDAVRVLSAAEVADLGKQGKLPKNPTCVETGASVSNPSDWAELGGKYYALCGAADASLLNAQVAAGANSLVQLGSVEPGQTNLTPTPSVRQSKGTFRVLVARFHFQGDPAIPSELSETVEFATKAASVIRDFSYGSSDVVPVFTPVITLSQSRQWYMEWEGDEFFGFLNFISVETNNPPGGFIPLIADAERSLREAGYDIEGYDHLHALFPPIALSNHRSIVQRRLWNPEGSVTADLTNRQAALVPFQPYSGRNTNAPSFSALDAAYQRNVHLMIVSLGNCFGISTASVCDTRVPWWDDYVDPWVPLPDRPTPLFNILEQVYGLPGFNRAGIYDGPSQGQAYEVIGEHPFDPMGSLLDRSGSPYEYLEDRVENSHFSAINKLILGWIPTNYVTVAHRSTTNRLYAFDVPFLKPGNIYALGVRKDVLRTNWIEYRKKVTVNPWVSRGVLINWGPWPGALSTCQLVDTTPGSVPSRSPFRGFQDSAVVLGRTFSDEVNNVHITPTVSGADDRGDWIDVVVQMGSFPENRSPNFTLEASSLRVATNEPITFTARNVVDPDGDALSYFWDFGDGNFGDNVATVQHSFPGGQYVIRCEVSDMKGGVRSSHVLVTVGDVSTTRVYGRVIDIDRNPVANVRIAALGSNDTVGFTDSDGRYTLAGIPSGALTNLAHLFGYNILPHNFNNPSPLTDGTAAELNYVAVPKITVNVETVRNADLSGNPIGAFRFKRNGVLSLPLIVSYRLDGDAAFGVDYRANLLPPNDFTDGFTNIFFFVSGLGRGRFFNSFDDVSHSITIPAGSDSVDLPIQALPNPFGGGTRSLIASVVLQSTALVLTNGGSFPVFVPDWHFDIWRPGTTPIWGQFQSQEAYNIRSGEAFMAVIDPAPELRPLVSLQAIGDSVNENGYDAGQILFALDRPIGRDLRVRYALTGTAKVGVDFVPLSGEVRIPAGSLASVLPIFALPNNLVEGNRDVTITIADGTDYDVQNARATVFIVDDDLPAVRVYSFNEAIEESTNSFGRFSVFRSGDRSVPLVVDYVFEGSATNGIDFRAVSGSVTIPVGSDQAFVAIRPFEDGRKNDPKSVVLQLSPSPRYNVDSPALATMSILDDQTSLVRIHAAVPGVLSTPEVGTGFELQLTRVGPATNALFVNYDVGGTAGNAADYRSIGRGAVIPAGVASVRIPIVPLADALAEWVETITVRLTPGEGYQIDPAFSEVAGQIEASDYGQFPSAEFTVEQTVVKESDGRLTVGIHLTDAHPQVGEVAVVEYRVAGGSAVYGQDYRIISPYAVGSTGFVSFIYDTGDPQNETSVSLTRSFTVELLDNKQKQGPRTIAFELAYPEIPDPVFISDFRFIIDTNGFFVPSETVQTTNTVVAPKFFRLTTRRLHWITILDDDAAEVSIEAVKPYAYESGVREGAFRILRTSTNGYADSMKVQFDVSGTAAGASDYEQLPRSVVIPAGQREIILSMMPVDDLVYEGPETITVTLVTAEGATIGVNKKASVTLVDDDGTIEFAEREFTFSERGGLVRIPVRRSGDVSLAQSVSVFFQAGTAAENADYTANSGILSFQPGEQLKYVEISLVDDQVAELPESLEVRLANLSGGVSLAGQTRTTVMILSDDTGFVFATNRYAVAEFDGGIEVQVLRTGDADGGASVRVGLVTNAGDSAVPGVDLVDVSTVLTFLDGETSKKLTLVPIEDDLLEGDESITLVLTDPVNGVVSPETSSAKLLVRDDDCTLELSAAETRVWEQHKTVRVKVIRNGGALNAVAVDYSTSDGTAWAGKDYTAKTGTLIIDGEQIFRRTDGSGLLGVREGSTEGFIDIPVLDDAIGEPNENFTVQLSNVRPVSPSRRLESVTLTQPTRQDVVILDNEQPGRVDHEYAPSLVFTQHEDGDTNGLALEAPVNAIALLPNGRAIIGGEFTEINDFTYRHIARLSLEGELDLGFDPGVGTDGSVNALATSDDGRIFLAGAFRTVHGVSRSGIALLTQEGDLDPVFDPGLGAEGKVARALAVQEDGFVLVGGEFTRFDGLSLSNLVRLTARGFVDLSFKPSIGGPVLALAVQGDGKIIAGGSFTNVNGSPLAGLVRLNADGSVDNSFRIGKGVTGVVNALTIQPDGQLLVGGLFTSINDKPSANLARLSVLGALDQSFPAGSGPNGRVRALGVHRLGKIYIGGDFTQLNGEPQNRFARLLADGSVDARFDLGAGADAPVRAVLVAANSAVYLGGEFTTIDGESRPRFARVHGDEKLALVGVEFITSSLTVPENVGAVNFTVRRVGDPTLGFSVDFSTTELNSTATAGLDYVATNGTLTFSPGVLSRTFRVQVLDDLIGEATESIRVQLDNAPFGVDLGGATRATIHVLDDEATVGLTTATYTGSEASGQAILTLIRKGNTNTTASVFVNIASGTALSGQDFDGSAIPVSFAALEVTKSVVIPVFEDRMQEGAEQFTVSLANASAGLLIANGVAAVTIVDNDFDTIVFVGSALAVEENANGSIDPGEVTTVNVALRNIGTADSTNLTATLLPQGGVVPIIATATYGPMAGESSSVTRGFTFRNTRSDGQALDLVLDLKDGNRSLGRVPFQMSVGRRSLAFSNHERISINDLGKATPYPSQIEVAGVLGPLVKATLTFEGVVHSAPGDLDVMLVAPNGEASVVMSDAGGTFRLNGVTFTLDDDAPAPLPSSSAIASGTYRPINYVVNETFPAPAPTALIGKQDLRFGGTDPNGIWSLFIRDDSGGDTGFITNGWTLTLITSGQVLPTTDLEVSVRESSSPVLAGQEFSYIIKVSNNGPAPATGVVLSQTLPLAGEASFVRATGGAVFAGGNVTAALGSLAPGANSELVVTVKTIGVGQLRSTVSVAGSEPELVPANNLVQIVTTVSNVVAPVPLSVSSDGATVTVSWSSVGAGVLETSSDPGHGNWSPIRVQPVLAENRYQVVLPASNHCQFYRLRQN